MLVQARVHGVKLGLYIYIYIYMYIYISFISITIAAEFKLGKVFIVMP